MDPQLVNPGPRISWRELLEALRTLLQRPEGPPVRHEELRRVVDPWEDDPYYEPSPYAESQRRDSALTPSRPENRFSLAAMTTLEVTTRLMALRVPPAVAVASGLIAGSLALLSPADPTLSP